MEVAKKKANAGLIIKCDIMQTDDRCVGLLRSDWAGCDFAFELVCHLTQRLSARENTTRIRHSCLISINIIKAARLTFGESV